MVLVLKWMGGCVDEEEASCLVAGSAMLVRISASDSLGGFAAVFREADAPLMIAGGRLRVRGRQAVM